MNCLACGEPTYSEEYVALWAEASLCFPLVALELEECPSCCALRTGRYVKRAFLLRRIEFRPDWLALSRLGQADREEWLQSGPVVERLDMSSPAMRRALRKSAKAAKRYRKLLAKQKDKFRKLDVKRRVRQFKRSRKPATRAMEEVLDRAAELGY